MTLQEAAGKLAGAKPRKIDGQEGYEALCFHHDDHNPSLHVWKGQNGWIQVKCRSCGAGTEEFCARFGLEKRDLRWDSTTNRKKSRPPLSFEDDYFHKDGRYLFTKQRYGRGKGKQVLQVVKDHPGGTVLEWNLESLAKEERCVLFRWPELTASTALVHVCEGEPAVKALLKAGEAATCQSGGAESANDGRIKWTKAHSAELRGRDVVVWADRDPVGEYYAAMVAKALREDDPGRSVMVVQSATPGVGDDAEDHYGAGLTWLDAVVREDLLARVPERPFKSAGDKKSADSVSSTIESQLEGRERKRVCVSGRQLRDVVSEVFSEIVRWNDPPRVFVRNNEFAVPVQNDRDGAWRTVTMNESDVRLAASEACDFYRLYKDGEESECGPPDKLSADLKAHWNRHRTGLPLIEGCSRCPVMRPDGSFAADAGYDPETRCYVAEGPWPDWDPSLGRPLEWLSRELLGDFPFDGEASRANALALVVLPFVRKAISGPTPMHYFGSPDPSTGKTLGVSACLWPGCAEVAPDLLPVDEEERRKKLATRLLEGRPFLFFDNVKGRVDSGALAMAVTARRYTDRFMGTMGSIDVPVRCGWAMTGNNVEFDRDTRRRTVWIQIDSGEESPERRTGWRHDDLLKWADENRPILVAACRQACTDWAAEGRPLFRDRTMGTYEEWAGIVGGILAVAGFSEFLGNQDALSAKADPIDEGQKAFFSLVWSERKVREFAAGDVLEQADQVEGVARTLGDGNDRSRTSRLGRRFQEWDGKVRGSLHFGKTRILSGKQMYRLTPTSQHPEHDPYDEYELPPEPQAAQSGLPYKDD